MNWTRVLKGQGWQLQDSGVEPDPFALLGQLADQNHNGPNARISYGLKSGYGDVLVNISLECPQNEACINLAAEVAFRKAHELVNDGASQLNVAGLNPIDEE